MFGEVFLSREASPAALLADQMEDTFSRIWDCPVGAELLADDGADRRSK